MNNYGGVVLAVGAGAALYMLMKYMSDPAGGGASEGETAGNSHPVQVGSVDPGSQVYGLPDLLSFPDNGAGEPDYQGNAPFDWRSLLDPILNRPGIKDRTDEIISALSGNPTLNVPGSGGGGGCCAQMPSNTYVTNYTVTPPSPVVIPPPMPYPQVNVIQQALQPLVVPPPEREWNFFRAQQPIAENRAVGTAMAMGINYGRGY